MKALSIKNLHKSYPGVRAVDGVDFVLSAFFFTLYLFRSGYKLKV